MDIKVKRSIELFFLFVVLPASLSISYPIWIKILVVLSSFIYVLYLLKKEYDFGFKIPSKHSAIAFRNRILVNFSIILILTVVLVYFSNPDMLFSVMLKKTTLWAVILLVYTLFSVLPQELIYRTFFFHRYQLLFKNKSMFIFLNATLFSLAHIFFRNTLVLILTFLGGLLFAFTYHKSKSTLLVSIEHAIYGNWLFTVGMGEMLAFPGAD
ncbi:MAG: CPBP family intramembrane metalloprotease [Aquimarina sp.]|nr:CPBP family intramembrane metalloprotease [Aquimarina sp.]